MANAGELDVVHVYANEEDTALPFAKFCSKPVVFTHHDPFDFLVKYRRSFPRYKNLNWISMSMAQRRGMPGDTNWVANIYHGLATDTFAPRLEGESDYVAYLGRIVEPKGVHLAIAAVKEYNSIAKRKLRLKIAGKHYSGSAKDQYWQKYVEPELGGAIEYLGHVRGQERQDLLSGAGALMVPSTFDEPFGMVMIEALACGTPVIGFESGAIPEVVRDGVTGFVVPKSSGTSGLAGAIARIGAVRREDCRREFEGRFAIGRMVKEHLDVYESLAIR
jgi:glycosyltransferase involved in cell wall biosynthesis